MPKFIKTQDKQGGGSGSNLWSALTQYTRRFLLIQSHHAAAAGSFVHID